jgi:hypothetical protein
MYKRNLKRREELEDNKKKKRSKNYKKTKIVRAYGRPGT